VAAIALGAEGVEVGTRFVATRECPAPDYFKQSIIQASGASTLLLGKAAMPIRVLKNRKSMAISDPDKAREDTKLQADGDQSYLESEGDAESAIMPAGQAASLIDQIKGVSDIFPEMISAARTLSTRLNTFFEE
jgi:enoyl-[acyl-carrier protein] reductase II